METLQLFFALITVILPNLPNKLHVAKKWNSPFCGNWLSILGCQSTFIPDPWFFPGNQHHKYISCCDYLLAEQYYYSLWVESIGKGVVLSGIDNIKKSNEDMILALAGQFKQLSHEPEKFRWLNGIRTHDLCVAGAVL